MKLSARVPQVRSWILLGGALLMAGFWLALAGTAKADGVPLQSGNVLVALGEGKIGDFTPTGTLLDTLDTTSGSSEETGMCFDGAGNLYTTNFEADTVSKFNAAGNLVQASWGGPYNTDPESCVVNQAQQVFVGQADGSHQVLEFDSSGTLLNSYSPMTQDRGTDWIDLESDGHTLHYTSEGSSVLTFDTATNTQGPNFADGLPAPCFAHRILPDGDEIVACATEVVLLDTSGNIVKTYPVDPNNNLFALSVNPDGQSFWTADFNGTVWNVDIASGTVLHTWNASPINDTAGMVVIGEQTVSGLTPIKASGTTINATEGKPSSGTVATFTASSSEPASDFSASINWGDGHTTTGTVSGSSGSFTVTGSNTYAEEGTYTVTVKITDKTHTSNTGTATSTAKVADAALHATGVSASRAGLKFKGTIAHFTDDDSGGVVSDYKATIKWGDGKSSTGTVAKSGSRFKVTGKHTYKKTGTFTVTVTIKDKGGSTATATSTITLKRSTGTAHLSGVPAACVLKPVTLRIRGSAISSVSWALDGSSVTGRTVHAGKQYAATFSVGSGNHAMTSKVTFKKSSHTKARTFHRTITGCAAVTPRFTG